MITAKATFGSAILSGLTFSLDNSAEEVQVHIGANDTSNITAHTIHRNKTDKRVLFDQVGLDLTVDNTFSVIFQADSVEDIEIANGTFFGLQNVVVELIP